MTRIDTRDTFAGMSQLEIPIRELHARTGYYVKQAAAKGRILVTHRGRPMAELRSLKSEGGKGAGMTWQERELLPEFAALMNEPVAGTDSTLSVSEDRDRG